MMEKIILDLGQITGKEYFIEFSIGKKRFKFSWGEKKIYELLHFIKTLDSATDRKSLKFEMEAETAIFSFLNSVNPDFTAEDFKYLNADQISKILETIIEPIFKKDTTLKGDGSKKKAPATMPL